MVGKPLSHTFVSRAKPGRYGDGRGGFGLYLRVRSRTNGRLAKSWGQRIRLAGRETNLGLGTFPIVTLAEARTKALHNRREVEAGRDPRRDVGLTFSDAAERVIRLHAKGWKNAERVSGQWRATFRDHAAPFTAKPVHEITSGDVLAALSPIWASKPTAARSALQRIGAVMLWAQARGLRSDNPAGPVVVAALPRQNGRRKHYAALPYAEVAAALATIRGDVRRSLAVRLALHFMILTAARPAEARDATWSEIDLSARVWTIPPERMKSHREHRVPLSDAALDVLRQARSLGSAVHCFPSPVTGKALANRAFAPVVQALGATAHGFRSSFRDWCGETGVRREVAEAALAHTVKGVEGCYARSDLLERRRSAMDDWGEYVTG